MPCIRVIGSKSSVPIRLSVPTSASNAGTAAVAASPIGPSLLPMNEAPLLNKEGDAAEVGGTAAPGVTAGDGEGGIAPGTPRGVLPSGNAC